MGVWARLSQSGQTSDTTYLMGQAVSVGEGASGSKVVLHCMKAGHTQQLITTSPAEALAGSAVVAVVVLVLVARVRGAGVVATLESCSFGNSSSSLAVLWFVSCATDRADAAVDDVYCCAVTPSMPWAIALPCGPHIESYGRRNFL